MQVYTVRCAVHITWAAVCLLFRVSCSTAYWRQKCSNGNKIRHNRLRCVSYYKTYHIWLHILAHSTHSAQLIVCPIAFNRENWRWETCNTLALKSQTVKCIQFNCLLFVIVFYYYFIFLLKRLFRYMCNWECMRYALCAGIMYWCALRLNFYFSPEWIHWFIDCYMVILLHSSHIFILHVCESICVLIKSHSSSSSPFFAFANQFSPLF